MASFYGGGHTIINGGGGAGSSNYNDLQNVPIENKTGTTEAPIILSQLDYGTYVITGVYQYNEDGEIKTENSQKTVQVFQDEITQQKVATFETFENGEYFINTLIYEEDGSYIQDKLSLTGSNTIPSQVQIMTF